MYVVLFYSQLNSDEGYEAMAQQINDLVRDQPGYLRHHSCRDESGFGLTVSYWEDLDSIRAWKQNSVHLQAQEMGRSRFYSGYSIEVCQLTRRYAWPPGDDTPPDESMEATPEQIDSSRE